MKERLGILFAIYLLLNISSAFQNIIIETDFYGWSYATPFYHAIAATRTLLFGSYDTLYMNIPILVGMFIFSSLLLMIMPFINKYVLVPRGLGIQPYKEGGSTPEVPPAP